MPTYEYRCQKCGRTLEAFQRMSDAPLRTCPECKEEALERIVSGGAGVLYKGEGWYVTDYSKKSSGGAEGSGKGTTVTPKSSSTATPTPAAAPPAAPSTSTAKSD